MSEYRSENERESPAAAVSCWRLRDYLPNIVLTKHPKKGILRRHLTEEEKQKQRDFEASQKPIIDLSSDDDTSESADSSDAESISTCDDKPETGQCVRICI